jgi:hypothetical protein
MGKSQRENDETNPFLRTSGGSRLTGKDGWRNDGTKPFVDFGQVAHEFIL